MGPAPAVTADQGTKLDDAGLDPRPSNANSDRLLCAFVPMICPHDARLEVYVGPDERVADKAEVRKPRGVKHDCRFDLARWPNRHPAIEKHPSTQVRRRCYEARGRDYGGGVYDSYPLLGGGVVGPTNPPPFEREGGQRREEASPEVGSTEWCMF